MDLNEIRISKCKRGHTFYSKCELFKNSDLIVEITEDSILIKYPSIDYRGKTHSVQTNNRYQDIRYFRVSNNFIKEGVFYPNEEHDNEDEILINLI